VHRVCADTWESPCPGGTDGPEYVADQGNCTSFWQCDFGFWCKFFCEPGLIYDPRPGQEGCKLPTELEELICLGAHNMNMTEEELNVLQLMRSSSIVKDKTMMNSPQCEYNEGGKCSYHYRPVIYGGESDSCGREFLICTNGWNCKMRCDPGLVFSSSTASCESPELAQC